MTKIKPSTMGSSYLFLLFGFLDRGLFRFDCLHVDAHEQKNLLEGHSFIGFKSCERLSVNAINNLEKRFCR